MANVLAFPARGSVYAPRPAYWSTYTVQAFDSQGGRVTLAIRALSADSAHCRARHDGYRVESVKRVVGS